MKTIIVGFMLTLVNPIFANEINLVKITSDTDRIPSFMYVVLDKNHDISEFGKKDLDKNGDVAKRQIFSTELDYEGVVLKRQNGRNILIMRGHNVGPNYGGILELDFLYNGVTGSRKHFDISLTRDGQDWLVTVDGKAIHHLHFRVHRKRILGVVGIRDVQIIN